MLHKILLLYPQSDVDTFNGTVECDEALVMRNVDKICFYLLIFFVLLFKYNMLCK